MHPLQILQEQLGQLLILIVADPDGHEVCLVSRAVFEAATRAADDFKMPDWEQREAIEAAVLAAKAPKPGLKTDDAAIPLGSAAYWFVDDHALANASNLRIEVQRPSDPAAWRTVLVADKPWELGAGCYWGGTSIVRLPESGRVRLYYVIRNCTGTTFKGFPKGDRWAVTAIAESEDAPSEGGAV